MCACLLESFTSGQVQDCKAGTSSQDPSFFLPCILTYTPLAWVVFALSGDCRFDQGQNLGALRNSLPSGPTLPDSFIFQAGQGALEHVSLLQTQGHCPVKTIKSVAPPPPRNFFTVLQIVVWRTLIKVIKNKARHNTDHGTAEA